MAVGNIAALMEDITRDSKILITRAGIIRTRERAISMGVTNTEALPLRFTASNETELEILFLQFIDALQSLFACQYSLLRQQL
jgi:hypothetical protein